MAANSGSFARVGVIRGRWMQVCKAWRAGVLSAVMTGISAGTAIAGPSVGQFEVKDLEAEPGTVEFQSQNAHSWGQSRRRFVEVAPGEYTYDDNSVTHQRHALEIEMSLTHFFRMRVGVEYEKERFDDPVSPAFANDFGGLKLEEIAAEGVVILVPVKDRNGVGLGALVEVEHSLESGGKSVAFGPILEAQSGAWTAIANLMLVHDFGGEKSVRDSKWDFAYAAQLKYDTMESWALALEAYGTVDRLGDSGSPGEARALFGDHDQHRIGPVLYYTYKADTSGSVSKVLINEDFADDDDEGTTITVGVGLLAGLTQNTPDATLKWTVEVEF